MPYYDHKTVIKIKRLFGEEVMQDFMRANLEQLEVAASASYAVRMVWDPREKRKANLAEFIQFARACCKVLIHQLEAYKAMLPTEPTRKSK